MEDNVLREITPLMESDFMYVADRRKSEFNYPMHKHEVFELNYVENAAGVSRIVGDSTETLTDYDLVLITSPGPRTRVETRYVHQYKREGDNHTVLLRLHLEGQPLQPQLAPLHQEPLRQGTQRSGVPAKRHNEGLSQARQALHPEGQLLRHDRTAHHPI